jgi:dimeric dUTPase (all-alpha-NTP-PPase superfamily)
MNLAKLYEAQKKLDEHIEKEHPRQDGEDRLAKKVLALLVEIGELANEARFFKFWSHDQNPRMKQPIYCRKCDGDGCYKCNDKGIVGYKNPLLEEFVDGLHFFLSIGLELNISDEEMVTGIYYVGSSLTYSFNKLFRCIGNLSEAIEYGARADIVEWYNITFNLFVDLGETLGFTLDQIEQAYFDKNKINHHRQEAGY